MSELALKLIRENIEKHERGEDASFLDLGNCGMREVPELVGDCIWVKEFSCSSTQVSDCFENLGVSGTHYRATFNTQT